jgi:hypothetical protein
MVSRILHDLCKGKVTIRIKTHFCMKPGNGLFGLRYVASKQGMTRLCLLVFSRYIQNIISH